MSEKEFRPRLDSRELQFLIHVLGAYDAMLTSRSNELKAAENEVRRLTKDFKMLRGYKILKQLKAKRTELTNLKAQHLYKKATVCRDFIRRFEELLDGKKPHPKWLATHYLEELTL